MIPFLYALTGPAASAPHAVEPAPLVFAEAPPPDWDGCPLRSYEIAMIGDVMAHDPQLAAAERPDGSYDFSGVFDPIAPWLQAADLTLANLETVLGGEDLRGYTGYPAFNTPASILDALIDAGVDILQTANNHCLDRGELGVLRTLDELDARGLLHAGTFRTPEERAVPWTTATLPGGLVVAFVAGTFSTNGIPLPKGKPHLVAHFDDGLLELEVAAARQVADLVVVGVHWGVEYSQRPHPDDVVRARRLVDAGADIVMGTHPHVLQPAEVLRATDEDGDPRDALVLYSLGNFVSNQRGPFKHGAVVARAEVLWCEGDRRVWVADAGFTPFWVDARLADYQQAYRVVPTPPLDATTCDDLDFTDGDCASALAHRDHAAEMFTAGELDWSVGRPEVVAVGFDWSRWSRELYGGWGPLPKDEPAVQIGTSDRVRTPMGGPR